MRIIGGRFGGHALAAVPKRGVRPTADPVREALFNILRERVEGALFLDLAAGTGAVGLEAFSRGAAHVVFVEKDRAAIDVIKRNFERLHLGDEERSALQIVASDVVTWLRTGPAALGDWGDAVNPPVLYLDPPYEDARAPQMFKALIDHGWVGPGVLLIVERRTGENLELLPLRREWQRRYGDTTLMAFSSPE